MPANGPNPRRCRCRSVLPAGRRASCAAGGPGYRRGRVGSTSEPYQMDRPTAGGGRIRLANNHRPGLGRMRRRNPPGHGTPTPHEEPPDQARRCRRSTLIPRAISVQPWPCGRQGCRGLEAIDGHAVARSGLALQTDPGLWPASRPNAGLGIAGVQLWRPSAGKIPRR